MAGNDKRLKYRRWLFWQQAGICYLQINQACQQRQGRMWCDVADGGIILSKGAAATFEHVVPKSKVRSTCLILLACSSCNAKKGSAPASDEHLELAKEMWKRWSRFQSARASPRTARKNAARLKQVELDIANAKRRDALGLDVLGNARQREKALRRLYTGTSLSLGR